MTEKLPRTRLVVTADLSARLPDAAYIAALAAAGDVACAVLFGANGMEDAALLEVVQAFQRADVAVLMADDPKLAREVGADGVHLTTAVDQETRYAAARRQLPSDQIIGVEPGTERHLAMLLGEEGADYVAFAVPGQADDLLWWSEVFEVPSVAWGTIGPEDARRFAAHGVEFIAVDAYVSEVQAIEQAVLDTSAIEA